MEPLADRSIRLAHMLSQQRVSVHVDPKTKQTYRFLERDQILRKYAGQEDVFGTFTSFPKLGVYPTSSFNTPIGVCCYPVDFIINTFDETGKFEVPYPPEERQKYLQLFRVKDIGRCLVFRPGDDKLISKFQSGLSGRKVEDSFEVIKSVVYKVHDYYVHNIKSLSLGNAYAVKKWFRTPTSDISDLDELVEGERFDIVIYNYFGVVSYYHSYNDSNFDSFLATPAGEKISEIVDSGVVPDPEPLLKEIWGGLSSRIREDVQFPFEKYFKALFHMVRGKAADYDDFKDLITGKDKKTGVQQRVDSDQAFIWNGTRHLSGFKPQTWTVLLRKLGFIGARDYGTGAIHENEPTQSIFFDPPSLKFLDIINNQVPQYTGNSEDRRTLSRWTREFSDSKAYEKIRNQINLFSNYSSHTLVYLKKYEVDYANAYTGAISGCLDFLYRAWSWINTHPDLVDQDFWVTKRADSKMELEKEMIEYWKTLQEMPDGTVSKERLEGLYKKLRMLMKILG